MMKKKTTKVTEKATNKKKLHNYFILGVILILVIGAVLYLCKWYKVYDEYQKEIPVIRGYLQEIVADDLEHFIMENPDTIIYICTSNDDKCRSFENNFEKLLKKTDYQNEIIYLNTTGIDQDIFVNKFNELYAKKRQLTTNYPAFILFEDGKAINILQASENKELTMSKVEHFLELNTIGE